MKKRILCTLITLCMVMCVALPIMSYATLGVSASDSSAYGTLLTPDTTPPIGWAEDESNPYGTKKVSPLPSPHGMSRSFTAIATQRGRLRRIIPRYTVSGISVSTLPNVHQVPIGFLLSIMLHLLLEQLTIHSARAETIMLSLSVFAIWIIPRTLRRSATGYKTL